MAREIERCELCNHALTRHNELGYCQVDYRYGQCGCDSVRCLPRPPLPGGAPT